MSYAKTPFPLFISVAQPHHIIEERRGFQTQAAHSSCVLVSMAYDALLMPTKLECHVISITQQPHHIIEERQGFQTQQRSPREVAAYSSCAATHGAHPPSPFGLWRPDFVHMLKGNLERTSTTKELSTNAIKDTVSVLYWYEELPVSNWQFLGRIFGSFFCTFLHFLALHCTLVSPLASACFGTLRTSTLG